MSFLVVLPDRNSAHRVADYTGAFLPEAVAFQARHGGARVQIDQSQSGPKRFAQLLSAIDEHAPEVLVDFGHGLKDRLGTLGVTRENVHELARALCRFGEHGPEVTAVTVVLYACLAGGGSGFCGDGSIADMLRDALVKFGVAGAKVWAHSSSGHTDKNPFSRCFAGPEAKPDNVGGRWVVAPGSQLWRTWIRECRGELRFRFPFMTPLELQRHLEAARQET